MIEQLYTAHGSQGAGAYYPEVQEQALNVDPSDYKDLFYVGGGYGNSRYPFLYQFRALWTLNVSPPYFFYDDLWLAISIPKFLAMAQMDIESMHYRKVLITMHDPSDTATIEQIATELEDANPGVSIDTTHSSLLDNKKLSNVKKLSGRAGSSDEGSVGALSAGNLSAQRR